MGSPRLTAPLELALVVACLFPATATAEPETPESDASASAAMPDAGPPQSPAPPAPPALPAVPAIDGHLTDRGHAISKADKKTIDDKLDKLQKDTFVDVAGWVVDVDDAMADEVGNLAYVKWKVGSGWNTGLLFVIPRSGGHLHLIQDPAKPALGPSDVSRVLKSDRPAGRSTAERINDIVATTDSILRVKCKRPRPRGTNDPAGGRLYGAGALLLLLAAAELTRRARKPGPAPDTTP